MTAPMRHGLVMKPGQRSPRTLLLLDERDGLLREAVKFFPHASDRAIANTIHDELGRYRATAWRIERSELTCPRRHDGRIRALYWHLLKTVDAVPSEPLIRKIISHHPVRYPLAGLECGASNPRRR